MRTREETLIQSAELIELNARSFKEATAVHGEVFDDPQDAYTFENEMKLAGELRALAEKEQ